MANLIPMYHWQDRSEWLVLEALVGVSYLPGQAGWVSAKDAWKDWVNLRTGYQCPRRGGGFSTFQGTLNKMRILGWVETRPIEELGKTRRGATRVEWRIRPGAKVGLYPADMAEGGIRWVDGRNGNDTNA